MTNLNLTVPRDLNDLAHHWQGFIVRELRRTGRVKYNAEDVLAHVLMKLVQSDIVNKFHAGKCEQSHPLTVDAGETAKMLGISLGDLLAFQVESDDSLDPVDAKGQPIPGGLGYTSPSARYLFTDVIALSATTTFPDQGVQEFPAPREPSVAQWKAYLSTAVRNHSANYTRTHHRRAGSEYLADNFFEFRSEEGGIEFESRLVDETAEASIEQAFNVAALLKRAPGLRDRKSAEDKTFFDLLQDGYTIREASKAVGLSRHERKVLAAHIGE